MVVVLIHGAATVGRQQWVQHFVAWHCARGAQPFIAHFAIECAVQVTASRGRNTVLDYDIIVSMDAYGIGLRYYRTYLLWSSHRCTTVPACDWERVATACDGPNARSAVTQPQRSSAVVQRQHCPSALRMRSPVNIIINQRSCKKYQNVKNSFTPMYNMWSKPNIEYTIRLLSLR